jgi:NADPH:quinone reductase-like Zn-dependent oxidoreductase
VDTAKITKGQRVLIHAAAGGVGHLAVQIAKSRGAYVIGTASSAKHRLLGELGLDEAVNYQGTRFEQVLDPVDVVLDLIGGEVARRSLDVLRPGGLLICLPSRAAADAVAAATARGFRATGMIVEPDGHGLEQLAGLVDAGELRPLVAETFPLERVADAHRLSETARTTGKIVLTI